jgi:hypothetical protein
MLKEDYVIQFYYYLSYVIIISFNIYSCYYLLILLLLMNLEPGDTEVHRPGVKQMTHENFLAMLKGLPEGKKDDATEDFAAAASGAEKRELDSIKKSARAKAATVIGGTQGSSGSSSSGAGAPAAGVTWNALLDDYPLAGQSMALKVRRKLPLYRF